MKLCSKCKTPKDESCFDKDTTRIDGLRSWCKECRKVKWFDNREENLTKKRSAYKKNRKKNLLYARDYAVSHKVELKEKRREYESRPEVRKGIRAYWNSRRSAEPMLRLNASMRAAVYHSIKTDKGGESWQALVGYTIEQLKAHLEKQFLPGMTWENYGEWEIDHETPLVAHNFTSRNHIDFRRAWSLKNLRPLWAFENRSKGGRLEKPFQPALAIGAR